MTRGSSVLFALLVATGAARAQSAAPSSVEAQADAALTEGRRLYDIQNWDQAIAKFKEAYTLRPDPASLFNLAQAQRLKNDCKSAAQSYKAYKRNFPTAKNISKIEKFITEMEACIASGVKPPTAKPEGTDLEQADPNPPPPLPPTTTDAAKQPEPPTSPPPVNNRGWMQWTGLGVGLVGLASAGIGIKFALDGKRYADDLKTLCATSCTSEQALAIEDNGKSANTKATIFAAVGGGLLVTGAVLFVLSVTGGSSEQPSVALVPTHGGAAASYSFSF